MSRDVTIGDFDEVLHLLRRWEGKHRILTRWPCYFCGRRSNVESLRTVMVTLEDGTKYEGGCVPCNEDELVESTVAALDRWRTR